MLAANSLAPGTKRMIQIAVLNQSTAISDADTRAMLASLHHQWNVDFQPIWGVGSWWQSRFVRCLVSGERGCFKGEAYVL